MPFNVPALMDTAACIRREAGDIPLAVGGHACRWNPDLAREVHAQISGEDADAFLAAVDAFFARQAVELAT